MRNANRSGTKSGTHGDRITARPPQIITMRWPASQRSRIAAILRTGRCPAYRVPSRWRTGDTVMLADKAGTVLVRFRLQQVVELPSKTRSGFVCTLVAAPRSVRRPRGRDPRRWRVSRYGAGAFLYFDGITGALTTVHGPSAPIAAAQIPVPTDLDTGQRIHLANNTGKSLRTPEGDLIRAYLRWVGAPEAFTRPRLPGTRMDTDLFLRSHYTLFEAKSSVERRPLREALGQLQDYQRYFPRHPRLALLVPRQPSAPMLALFAAKHVAVVWRSRGGAFTDSVRGTFSTTLRRAQARAHRVR